MLLLALPAQAAPTRAQLRAAEQAHAAELKTQAEAAARAEAARADVVRLSEAQQQALDRLHAAEAASNAAAERVQGLEARRAAAAARLAQRAADMGPLLPLLERLSLYPAETLLALNLPPDDAVRGMLVLGGLVRQLEEDAAALRAEQAQVTHLQALVDAEMPALDAARATQAKAAEALDAQLRETRAAAQSAEAEAAAASRRAAEQAARASDLRAAIAQIEAARKAEEARARHEAEQAARRKQKAAEEDARNREKALASPAGPGLSAGSGFAPVAGTVVRNWGDATLTGPAVGVTYQAAAGARVVSPCAGRVVFAAPFRSFGLLMIVDCGGDYHFVLSGFQRMDARVGARVASGGPLGVMPDWDPRSGGARPLLYIELRHKGAAVDPASFLRGKG